MRQALLCLTAIAFAMCIAWAEDAPKTDAPAINPAITKTLSDTVAALSSGEAKQIEALLSVQTSELIMPRTDGFTAVNSTSLQKKPELAAQLRIPAGYAVQEPAAVALGPLTIVQAKLQAEGKPDKLLSGAITEEAGSWRYVMLSVLEPKTEANPETLSTRSALTDILQTWAAAFPKGDVSSLEERLNDDPFSVAVTGPGGQLFAFAYPDYFIGMVNSFLAMGAAEYSALENIKVQSDGSVAIATANWDLSISAMGQVKGKVLAHFCKTPKGWRLVGMIGGVAG